METWALSLCVTKGFVLNNWGIEGLDVSGTNPALMLAGVAAVSRASMKILHNLC